MKLLDLFCGAGGAAMGYYRAGFTEIIGVDINPQPHYPFTFIQADALDFNITHSKYLLQADLIHASPPCQRYSDLARRNGNAHQHPDLLPATRQFLRSTGLTYVIENVSGAPLEDPIWLCGTMFPPLAVLRHRGFESNVPITPPLHRPHPLVYTRDKRKAHYGKLSEHTSFVSVNGGGNCSVTRAREAMGINWMTKAELNEAIPPAYTNFIGQAILSQWQTTSMPNLKTSPISPPR